MKREEDNKDKITDLILYETANQTIYLYGLQCSVSSHHSCKVKQTS